VTASGDDDIWIQNFGGFAGTFPVTRWNGTTWLDVSPTFPSGTVWSRMWLSGTNEVWLPVQLPTPVTADLTEIPQPALYHWVGSAWTETPSPLDSMVGGAIIGPMWSSSPSDVWLAVTGTTNGFIHWDGHAWATAAVTLAGQVYSLWGSSATDIWAGGISHSTSAGLLWHFNGKTWTEVDLPANGIFEGLWGTCSGDFWTSVDTGNITEVWHYDGTAWSIFNLGSPPGIMVGSSPDDVWMTVPNTSTLRHRQPGFCGDGVIEAGEQCDPPLRGPDGLQCGSNCQLLTCGNGVIDPGEQCDPPKSSGTAPLCSQTCQIPICGNGVVDPGEACDPPNGIVCDSNCQSIPIVCGDGIVQPGESCDFPNPAICSQCQITGCGGCYFQAIGGDSACQSVTGTARVTCQNLLSCLAEGIGRCYLQPPGTGACFCGAPTCSAGANGQCAFQFEAVAGTTDPAVVLQQLSDPTSLVSRVRAEGQAFANDAACGMFCRSL